MMSIFCNHDYELIQEVVTKSAFEVAYNTVKTSAKGINIPWQMCNTERKHITTLKCTKCGKLKRFVENLK